MTRLVLLGGGHAHVHVLERLATGRPRGAEVVLVSPSDGQIYSGMLPGWIAGTYRLDECVLPVARLAERAGVSFVRDACVRLDADHRRVDTRDGRTLDYDLLSLDVGSAVAASAIPGADACATPVRPLDGFVAAVQRLLEDASAGRDCDVLVIGGGAAGVEIAFALAARLDAIGRGDARVAIVGAASRPLDGLPRLLQLRAAALMRRRGIRWFGGRTVARLAGNGAAFDDGSSFPARHVLLATGAAAHAWLARSSLATDDRGFVRVDATLASASHPDVFAAGDCAAYSAPRPKSGVFAVRAGPVLAANLLRRLDGGALVRWRPQRHALYLVSTARGDALGAWGPLAWWGRRAWRWKDRIDRAFIARFAARRGPE